MDNAPYFITGATFKKRPLLAAPELKLNLTSIIKDNFLKTGWKLEAYVVLDNHYHLLAVSDKGKDLPLIIKGIHGASSRAIRQKVN